MGSTTYKVSRAICVFQKRKGCLVDSSDLKLMLTIVIAIITIIKVNPPCAHQVKGIFKTWVAEWKCRRGRGGVEKSSFMV